MKKLKWKPCPSDLLLTPSAKRFYKLERGLSDE